MRQILLLILLACIATITTAQNRAFYLGVQPSVRTQDYYQQGEFDLNLVPIVAQLTINNELDIRMSSIVDYHIPDPVVQTNTGFEVAIPIAINPKVDKDVHSEGLFIAPVYSYYNNNSQEMKVHQMSIEPGYMWVIDNRFGISGGLQLGAKNLRLSNRDNEWQPHIAFKLVLGYWFRRDVFFGL